MLIMAEISPISVSHLIFGPLASNTKIGSMFGKFLEEYYWCMLQQNHQICSGSNALGRIR
jgi:hypothetical protein